MARTIMVFEPCKISKREIKAIQTRISQLKAELKWLKQHRHAPDVDAVIPLVTADLMTQEALLAGWEEFASIFGCR